MTSFQPQQSLADFQHLRNIYEHYELFRRHRNHLLLALYRYRAEREYKSEGFSTFKSAFAFLKSVCEIDLQESTLWKYCGVFNRYARRGYAPREIIGYPISRLITLKPLLGRLSREQFQHLMQQEKREFEKTLTQLRKEEL